MNTKNLLYCFMCLSVSIIIGAAVYEHLVIWPTAFEAPPASLTMFQGEYAASPGVFWRLIHPVNLVLFLISLVLSWKTERKMHVLIPFVVYIIIMVITSTYFVPELLEIISTPFSDQIDQSLVERGSLWQILSLIRLVVLVVLAVFMYLGLTKKSISETK